MAQGATFQLALRLNEELQAGCVGYGIQMDTYKNLKLHFGRQRVAMQIVTRLAHVKMQTNTLEHSDNITTLSKGSSKIARVLVSSSA